MVPNYCTAVSLYKYHKLFSLFLKLKPTIVIGMAISFFSLAIFSFLLCWIQSFASILIGNLLMQPGTKAYVWGVLVMNLLPPIHTLFVQIMLCYVFWTFILLILLFCCVGNACGYGFEVTKAPFSSMVFDASRSLFKFGKHVEVVIRC